MAAKDKPKVLFVMHLPPPLHGASKIGAQIYDSEAIKDAFECRFINLATAENLADIGKGGIKKFTRILRLKKQVLNEAKEFEPDIIYLTPCISGTPFFKDYLIARALKKKGFKTVYHLHNKGVSKYQDKKLFDILYKKFFKGSKIVLLSNYLYTDISRYVDRNDCLVCPNGITVEYGNIPERKSDIPEILFLSNLFVSKGILTVLDIAAKLKAEGVKCHFTIAGAPTAEVDNERLEQEISRRNLSDIVKYSGGVYGQQKADVFKSSDIFIFPTKNECFPLVLLEAMAAGLPCVTSCEGGIRDIVMDGRTGYCIEGENIDGYASALKKIISDHKLRRQLSANALKDYNDRFTLGCFERNIISSLKSCI